VYEQFSEFVGKKEPPNRFWPLTERHVRDAERRLGYTFPSELRWFFSEIGCGFFSQGILDKKRDRSLVNGVLSPAEIADLLLKTDNPLRPGEGFMEGVMPFFDVGESSYLVLRPASVSPNRVYWPDGKEVISETLQEFFNRLHEQAGFYRKT
jgi:hypothetical protein